MPRISIITPVYNAERTLQRCIESVLCQSYADYEWILIDDGSVDESGKICDDIAQKYAFVNVLHTPNRGVSSARNTGIDLALGEYIFFLDSDDYIERNTLLTYIGEIEAYNPDVLIGGLSVIEELQDIRFKRPDNIGVYGENVWELICLNSDIFGYAGGKMFRAAIARDNNIRFRTDMRSQEDFDFFLSMYQYANKVQLIDCVGYQYYYVSSKRIPPVWDFIANQIKLLSLAEKKINLSEYARECVLDRIALLLYTCLYHASSRTDYNETIHKLVEVEGIFNVLQEIPVKKEKGFIVYCFVRRKYERIRRYFYVRNRIRDLVRKVRRK